MRDLLAVLPVQGRMHLCRVRGREFEALTEAPGSEDALHVLSDDGAWLSVMDGGNRRAGLFQCLPEAPWLVEKLSCQPLSLGCIGHTVLGWDGQLFVGGHGEAGEALWRRSEAAPQPWREIALPDGVKRRGKAIDGLHVIGGNLIAVDDIVLPKWLLVYELLDEGDVRYQRKVRLPRHSTYERVRATCLGPHGLVVLSNGINYGRPSTHVFSLDVDAFERRFHFGALGPATDQPDVDPSRFRLLPATDADERCLWEGHLARALLGACDVAQTRHAILVACGAEGLLAIRNDDGHSIRAVDSLMQLSAAPLASIERLVVPRPADGSGAFVVGMTSDGQVKATWIPDPLA